MANKLHIDFDKPESKNSNFLSILKSRITLAIIIIFLIFLWMLSDNFNGENEVKSTEKDTVNTNKVFMDFDTVFCFLVTTFFIWISLSSKATRLSAFCAYLSSSSNIISSRDSLQDPVFLNTSAIISDPSNHEYLLTSLSSCDSFSEATDSLSAFSLICPELPINSNRGL